MSPFPCINCITLPICKASVQDYYDKEPHLQTGTIVKLLIKCDLIDYYAHIKENEHRDLDVIIIDQIRNI